MKRDFATYHVGLKILLRNGKKVLFLRSDNKRWWDQPGGRIDNVEDTVPLEKIIAREVKEELGNIKYVLGKPLFQFRRFGKMGNLLTIYDAQYVSGKIKLSVEHSGYKWIDPVRYKFNKKDFMSKEEYEAFVEYFTEVYLPK
jgi:8-oxo-dGTP pyrophosphatase MutT (NUDIX family)